MMVLPSLGRGCVHHVHLGIMSGLGGHSHRRRPWREVGLGRLVVRVGVLGGHGRRGQPLLRDSRGGSKRETLDSFVSVFAKTHGAVAGILLLLSSTLPLGLGHGLRMMRRDKHVAGCLGCPCAKNGCRKRTTEAGRRKDWELSSGPGVNASGAAMEGPSRPLSLWVVGVGERVLSAGVLRRSACRWLPATEPGLIE